MLDVENNKWLLFTSAGLISLYAGLILSIGIYLEASRNLIFFVIAMILTLAVIVLYVSKKHQIKQFLKAMFLNESAQTEALIESLNNMVSKLEYRDNVLVVEKNLAVQANRAKSDFLVSMSHELRTPMHAILNFAEMGRNKLYENDLEKIKLYFVRIEESGERLVRLIDNLLDLTRLEEGETTFRFQKNNIITCIEYVCDEMNSLLVKKSIKIDIQKNHSKNSLIFDKDHIIRVLINLVSNAVKYSPTGSTIRIILENVQFSVSGGALINGLKVSVVDEGAGIAEGETEMIFNKFIQGSIKAGKEVGSGLGLAIVKEIIIAHGGNIWAENTQGGGACISFILPDKK